MNRLEFYRLSKLMSDHWVVYDIIIDAHIALIQKAEDIFEDAVKNGGGKIDMVMCKEYYDFKATAKEEVNAAFKKFRESSLL